MTSTEELLIAKLGGPVVKLTDICEEYLGNGPDRAKRRAGMNGLPFPAFRLDPTSHKTPWMVMVSDIAAYIDMRAAQATKSWTASQL